MPRAQRTDLGGIWRTVREVDVNAVRREAQRGVSIACVGDRGALRHVHRLLRGGAHRFALAPSPLALIPASQVATCVGEVSGADLLVVALDSSVPLGAEDLAGLDLLSRVERPAQMLLLFGDAADKAGPWPMSLDRRATTVVDPQALDSADRVAAAILGGLPAGLHLAAARRAPGLRAQVARRVIAKVSLSNAAFVLATGVPAIVPILGLPMSAADTVVLTKNQALMVYRLALAFGAPPEFQRRMAEIASVVGAAWVWRQAAATLVGLVPGYGIVPKIAVAYAGTYVVGRAAELWYQTGLIGKADLRRFSAEARARAGEVAEQLAEQAREARGRAGEGAGRLRRRLWSPRRAQRGRGPVGDTSAGPAGGEDQAGGAGLTGNAGPGGNADSGGGGASAGGEGSGGGAPE